MNLQKNYQKYIKNFLRVGVYLFFTFIILISYITTFSIPGIYKYINYKETFATNLKKNTPVKFTSFNNLTNQANLISKKIPIQREIPILMYHYIRDYHNPSDALGINLSVSPANLDRQLQDVKSKGYQPVIFQDILDYTRFGKPLPKKPIIISFDDGYDNHYTEAYKMLTKYNFKGSFGVITGFVGHLGYLNWKQIKEMKNNGQEMISHTVNHPDLAQLSNQNLIYELKESKRTLDIMLNQNTQVLIYPSGKYNLNVIEAAKESGYSIARTTEYGREINSSNFMELPTIRMFDNSEIPNIHDFVTTNVTKYLIPVKTSTIKFNNASKIKFSTQKIILSNYISANNIVYVDTRSLKNFRPTFKGEFVDCYNEINEAISCLEDNLSSLSLTNKPQQGLGNIQINLLGFLIPQFNMIFLVLVLVLSLVISYFVGFTVAKEKRVSKYFLVHSGKK